VNYVIGFRLQQVQQHRVLESLCSKQDEVQAVEIDQRSLMHHLPDGVCFPVRRLTFAVKFWESV